jgi:hypothetical protein
MLAQIVSEVSTEVYGEALLRMPPGKRRKYLKSRVVADMTG